MGAHIVSRRPPVTPPQPAEHRPTTELTEQQLQDLIRNHAHERFDRPHEDLEAELELIDALPTVFPDATPVSLPRMSLPRLAHTTRRGSHSGDLSALHELDEHTDIATIVMPRNARPSRPATATPRAESSARAASELPSTERPTQPAMPCIPAPALASSEAEPHPVMAREALPPVDVAPSELPLAVEPPRRSALAAIGRVRLGLPVVPLLLALGAGALWLLQ